jgi:hypothetical protein
MHKQEWIERPAFDSASTWSYSVLVLTLALVAHAWITAQPNLGSPQRLISPASLPEETFTLSPSNSFNEMSEVNSATKLSLTPPSRQNTRAPLPVRHRKALPHSPKWVRI